jgi:transposase-like protein
MDTPSPFKWRHFEGEMFLLCVRWYLRYALSYRDVEELARERGLSVDHTTVFRWVQRYAPELDQRCRPHLPVGLNKSTKTATGVLISY